MKTDNIQESNKYHRASKRVDELKGFYSSLIAYLVTIPFLAFINYQTNWHYQWFWWPMFGWGIGIVFQGIYVYSSISNWEERKIREFMKNDNN
ncbi:MAG: 2TM domain-containing protein [Flavobacteriaceae bacterium]|nr:2TM domain-containing protein [Flavobacteriaceae bacterium]